MTAKGIYLARANSSPTIGDDIIDYSGNQYKVDDVDYDDRIVFADSTDGERCSFPFVGFENGEYRKVLK